MPKGYIIGHVTVHDAEAYKDYVAQNSPVLAAYGGKPLVRGGTSETPEGPQFTRHVCFEYPDYASAKAAYYSKEYQEIMKIRIINADSMIVLVEGAD
jgi:uncharacterized protein (DUF1330 family)